MRNSPIVAGVSFHGSKIQVALVEEQANGPVLHSIREVEHNVPNDAWVKLPQNPDASAKLANALSSAFEPEDVPEKLSVALPGDAALILSAPLDKSLDARDLRDHIDWELSNYHRGQRPQEFVSNYMVLEKFGNREITEILIVELQRSILLLLRKACERLKTQLHIVDLDHFCTEPLLAQNHPNTRTQTVLLVGNKKNRTEVSLIVQSQLKRYRYGLGKTDVQKVELVEKFISECRDARVFFDGIFLYGDAIESSARARLQSSAGIPAVFLDPLGLRHHHRDEVSSALARNIENGTLHPSRFAPCIGVAIRTS